MKEIEIKVKLKIQDDLDEQDILDQLALVVTEGICHEPSIIEFIDAELEEPPKIDVVSLIDDVIANLKEMFADDKYRKGMIDGLKQLKDVIEHDKLPVLFPDLNKLSGETLTQSMRLTKAEKLLADTQNFLNDHKYLFFVPNDEAVLIMIGKIAEYLNADETPGSAPGA